MSKATQVRDRRWLNDERAQVDCHEGRAGQAQGGGASTAIKQRRATIGDTFAASIIEREEEKRSEPWSFVS